MPKRSRARRRQMGKRPRLYQLRLAYEERADQIIPRYRRSRKRAPTPCPNCGSRQLSAMNPTTRQMLREAHGAPPFPPIICTHCRRARGDCRPAADPA